MPDIKAQTADGNVHVFPDGTAPEVIDRVIKQYVSTQSKYSEKGAAANPPVAPSPNPISTAPTNPHKGAGTLGPAGALVPTPNALPAAGMIAGGALGSVEPGAGNVVGATLGGMAGEQAKRLMQGKPTTNKQALVETGKAGAEGATSEMGGQIIGKGMEALPNISRIIPRAERAKAGFQQVAEAANHLPVNTSEAKQVADRAMQLGKRGQSVPQVMRNFYNRLNDPQAPPMTFQEARDFYTSASQLSSKEMQETKAVMKAQIGKFASSLNSSLENTADTAGMKDTYQSAMKEYRQAKSLARTWKNLKKTVVPAAVGGELWYQIHKAITK